MFGWRKATWALIIFDMLMAIWMVSSLSTAGNNCAHVAADGLAACQVGTGIGAGFVFVVIGGIWFVGFIVLSLIWLMSRPQLRLCPECGYKVKRGRTECRYCDYSFV